jgi:hypothetical protein
MGHRADIEGEPPRHQGRQGELRVKRGAWSVERGEWSVEIQVGDGESDTSSRWIPEEVNRRGSGEREIGDWRLQIT